MPSAIHLPQTKAPQRQRALLFLGALVLGAHLLLLLAPGASIWQISPDAQKSGPLQTRIVPVLASQSLSPNPTSPKPKPQALAKARPAEVSSNPSTLPPAGITALASEYLPAPEASEPAQNAVSNAVSNAVPVTEPGPAPENELAATTAPAPPMMEAAAEPPEKSAAVLPPPPLPNALTAKIGDLPPNIQINYKLMGQERGFTYHASGYLKWQAQSALANGAPRAYEAELKVRAFLVGSRVWRSTGSLTENGLAPLRYSDNWRVERAAHFETATQKISFSGNMPSAELKAGAQDQVSLFIQMAAAVSAKSYEPGAQLNVQTATARDAVNWALTFKSKDTIELDGKQLETQRWVCLPRGKFDSQIELWLSPTQGGLPVRIKISQVNGNYIDMEMRNAENLPALPS
jgi:hypothetical protein